MFPWRDGKEMVNRQQQWQRGAIRGQNFLRPCAPPVPADPARALGGVMPVRKKQPEGEEHILLVDSKNCEQSILDFRRRQ